MSGVILSKMYSQQKEDSDSDCLFFFFLHSLHLTDTKNNILKAEVTLEEINPAITRLKAGSSPGTDGFTSECCKVLRDKLPSLMRAYNWVLQKLEIFPLGERQQFPLFLKRANIDNDVIS